MLLCRMACGIPTIEQVYGLCLTLDDAQHPHLDGQMSCDLCGVYATGVL